MIWKFYSADIIDGKFINSPCAGINNGRLLIRSTVNHSTVFTNVNCLIMSRQAGRHVCVGIGERGEVGEVLQSGGHRHALRGILETLSPSSLSPNY